jgi:FtsP/CotA-like multicopper oxidase with cupredoxin domain
VSRRYSRRAVLKSGAAAAAGLALTPLASGRILAQSASPSAPPAPTPAPVPTSPVAPLELPQPEVIRSADGLLRTSLTARAATIDMRAGGPVQTWTYDGVVPGRTWEVRAGDTLDFDVINELPPMPAGHPVDMTRPHEWTTTNIHTHGLHVSPSDSARGVGDNVFASIPPGERLHYNIPIPADHTGGMFWYHPHKHGGVCQQVRAGMAGTIVVRGAIDEVEEVAAAKEQLMVLQAIELDDQYQLLDPIPKPTPDQAFFPRTQILYTVNGVMTPKVTMYPGEVQRWRFLNAAEGKFMSLQLQGHGFQVLAWDGLTQGTPTESDVLMLSAANRVDVLVKAGEPGDYPLVLTPGSSQHPDIPGMPPSPAQDTGQPPPPAPISSAELETRPIMTLEVRGSGPDMGLPTALPAYDPPIRDIGARREVAYTVQREADNEFMTFGIDGVPFDPDRAPYQMKLGSAEEWTVYNSVDNKLPRHAHNFHIHVNPFKITRINGITLDTPLWRDTWVLTGGTGDSFTFETNIDDFTGAFVEHCHVLSHEDLGMMEALEVIP